MCVYIYIYGKTNLSILLSALYYAAIMPVDDIVPLHWTAPVLAL